MSGRSLSLVQQFNTSSRTIRVVALFHIKQTYYCAIFIPCVNRPCSAYAEWLLDNQHLQEFCRLEIHCLQEALVWFSHLNFTWIFVTDLLNGNVKCTICFHNVFITRRVTMFFKYVEHLHQRKSRSPLKTSEIKQVLCTSLLYNAAYWLCIGTFKYSPIGCYTRKILVSS